MPSRAAATRALTAARIRSAGSCRTVSDEAAPAWAASLKQPAERRRQGLTVLVGRLRDDGGSDSADLVDVLFALTTFEMFEALSVRNRRPKAVEALVQSLVEQAVDRYC